MSSLSIYLLGPPRLERDGVAVHFARRRTLAFTLYLAVTGEPHHRERLTSLFWPESEPGRARASLRRALYQINQTLGEGWIETEGDTVRFADNGALWLDVDQFRRSMAACREHGHASETVCHDCLPLLAEAVGLYRNDFLAGFSLRDSPEFDDWQFFQGETLRDELALALERLVHGHTALEQYPQAIAYARRRLALDVLHEPAHRWLMQLYAWHGRHAAALCQYEQCVRLLAEEMDVPPAPETEQLYQAIKARRLPPLLTRAGGAGSDGGASAEQRVDDDIRVVTVLCAGLADAESMESAAALDSLAAAMQVLQSIVVEACTPLGGRVEPAAGEAFLVLFGVNQGHEDDAERGIRAAAAIRRQALLQGLAVQIGLDTGLAYCRRQASPHESSLQATMMNAAVMGDIGRALRLPGSTRTLRLCRNDAFVARSRQAATRLFS